MAEKTENHDRRIDYVEFNVADIAAAKAFYGSAFGWRFTDYGPNYCEFDDGRLKGGFTDFRTGADGRRAAGRRLCQRSGRGADLSREGRRHDLPADHRFSRRPPLPLPRPRWLRARRLGGHLAGLPEAAELVRLPKATDRDQAACDSRSRSSMMSRAPITVPPASRSGDMRQRTCRDRPLPSERS